MIATVARSGARPLLLVTVLATLAACFPASGDAGGVSSRPPTDAGASPSAPAASSAPPSTSPTTASTPGTPAASPPASSPPASTPRPTAAPTSPPPPAAPISLTVYFFMPDDDGNASLVPVQRQVPQTVAVARAAMGELLAGPSADESGQTFPITTAIPSGTVLLDIAIDGGVATVDLSREFESGGGTASMTGRLAQVVYTLTQFPTVSAVAFRLDGEPVEVFSGEGIVLDRPSTREHYTEQLPEIFVDRPAYGTVIGNPVRVTGLTRVFEAAFVVAVYDSNGNEVAYENAMATCGSGCWGTFDVTLSYDVDERQPGSLVVWNGSAMDGSPENIRAYPVTLTP